MVLENIILNNEAAGSRAEIAPALGFNCHRFVAPHAGRPVEVLYAAEKFLAGTERPSGSGTPILFPFPGRIAGASFVWEGRQYRLEAADGRGNAIHGFVYTRPWRVVEQTATRVVGQFHALRDDPSLTERWPTDFRITATYVLDERVLKMHYLVENPGKTPLPCGLGTHPYFQVPLGGPEAAACVVKLPVAQRWELAELLPTGRRLNLEQPGRFAAGQPFGELRLDDAFSGLAFSGGWCQASIHDPHSGASVTVAMDTAFREMVVYTPPHRQAICIEPCTCVPGAMVLTARGIDAGLRIVPPGGSFEARVELRVE
jgi:aldose 1-epimerase